MTDHPYYGLFLVMCHYELRRGEAFGLHWKDIDFTEKLYISGSKFIS